MDTHAIAWWILADPRLSKSAHAWIADDENEVFVSAASAWEIATKERVGKPLGVNTIGPQFLDLIAADGFTALPITHRHAIAAGVHPAAHRDPFDRLLAAQAVMEGLTLVSRDGAFEGLGIRPVW